jgi:peptidyl-prolyl cis-trans isomerase SDCCAG10
VKRRIFLAVGALHLEHTLHLDPTRANITQRDSKTVLYPIIFLPKDQIEGKNSRLSYRAHGRVTCGDRTYYDCHLDFESFVTLQNQNSLASRKYPRNERKLVARLLYTMSNLYNLEPQPTAKVLLQTTSGDIIFELFAKQTPLASRNFLQHCLDGYYNGTIFHRVVPGFIIQGGDPTGTGFGGESTFEDGAPFADEFHSRLKYNRRGLLGMANSGKKNDNGSQFFITLGETPELAGKNTLFGRIAGDTIYNVMKMADAEMAEEGGDRPLYPHKVTGAEILVNPFEDMEKRDRVARSKQSAQDRATKKKPKRKAGKALLSFGDDGDENGPSLPVVKKPKFNPKLVAAPEPARAAKASSSTTNVDKDESHTPKKSHTSSMHPTLKRQSSLAKSSKRSPSPESESSASSLPAPASRKDQLNQAQAEIDALKASLRRPETAQETRKEKPKSALEAMIPPTSTRGRKRGAQNSSAGEEARTLALFKAFRNKLETADDPEDTTPAADDYTRNGAETAPAIAPQGDEDDEAALCDLHFIANCQSCSNWTSQGQEDDETADGWMNHTLSFEKDRLGKDLEWKRKNEEELVVVDPLEKARELGLEKVAKPKDKRSTREWNRGRGGKEMKSR